MFLILNSHQAVSLNHQQTQGDTTLASQYNLQAMTLARAKNIDSAIYYFKQAAIQYRNADTWDRFFYAHNQVGYLLNVSYRYIETEHYLDSIASKYSARLTSDLISYQFYYSILAWSHFRQLNFDKALYNFNLIDRGEEVSNNVKPSQILYSNYYQGVIYQRIGQYDLAMKYMLLTVDISKKHGITSFIGKTYNNLGIIYRNLGEYERALEFYKRALTIEKQYKKEVDLTPIYNNIGMIYYYLRKYDAALKELDYALDVLTGYTRDYYSVESSLINAKAKVLMELEEYSRAKIILHQVLEREILNKGEQWAGSGPTLKTIGMLYAKISDYNLSNDYFNQSIEIVEKTLGEKTDKLSEIFNLQAHNYLLTKKYDSALLKSQQSMISLVVEFNDLNYKHNPSVFSVILDKVELIESLYLKAGVLLSMFNNSGDINYLMAAKDANQTATLLVDIVRRNMLYESSKINLSERAKAIQEQAIITALLLEKETDQPAAARVFEAMEDSKAYLLSEAVQKAKTLGYSNIPVVILSKEDSFSTIIKVLEMKRNNILLRAKDTTGLAHINQQLFNTKGSFEVYKQSHASEKSVYQHIIPQIPSFQANFASHEIIIEYFAGESMLYAIALDKTQVKVYELGEYQDLINSFVGSVKGVQNLLAEDFQEQAYAVYEKILAPVLTDYKQATHLVIIPDKQLGFIPFDALITKHVDNPKYNELAYLVKNYTLMQHQTATLYIDQKSNHEKANQQFIGFAPDFDANELMVRSRNQSRGTLQPLPFAKREVETISNLLNGDEEIGINASETNLKAKASAFNILHLATHAIIDEENPIYSKLIFTKNDSTPDDDGELYSFEIYSMQLNCALVTLSACNTGTGKYYDGEGVFSLGRSFLLAGAESVLTSLWEVSDKSTSQIMESFYANIKQGASNPEALRQAKLKYLASADPLTANPHYWAAFVYIGKPDTIYQSYTIYYWMLAILLLFIGFTYAAMKSRKKPG